MKHPKILAGRGGLPPTSNIPWSAEREHLQRRYILLLFIMMWLFLALTGLGIYLQQWPGAIITALFSCALFFKLQKERRQLYAILLNKPRDTRQLTRWIQHKWRGWLVEDRLFVCECDRDVHLESASYFKDSNRYAMVCECGIGHFQVPPPLKAKP
jgi:hypothetical protein